MEKDITDFYGIGFSKGDEYIRSEIGVGVKADALYLSRFIKNPKRRDIFIRIDFVSHVYSFRIDRKSMDGRRFIYINISDNANEHKGNSHNRT